MLLLSNTMVFQSVANFSIMWGLTRAATWLNEHITPFDLMKIVPSWYFKNSFPSYFVIYDPWKSTASVIILVLVFVLSLSLFSFPGEVFFTIYFKHMQ